MVGTILGELKKLESSTDSNKREVGARLRTAIRNVLLDEISKAKCLEFLADFPPRNFPWDIEILGDNFIRDDNFVTR
jgi:hypothetical protein